MGPLRMFIVNANQGTSIRSLPVALNSFSSSPITLSEDANKTTCVNQFSMDLGTIMMHHDWCPLKFVLPAASQLSVM